MTLLDANETINLVAALSLLAGGVVMIVVTLRNQLKRNTNAADAHAKRAQAEADYWRTLDSAVDKLGEVATEITRKCEERNQRLDKLAKEAAEKVEKLEALMKRADAELAKSAQAAPSQPAATAAAPERGKIVDFQAATAALVKRNHRRVYEAFDSGQTIQEISRETGLQVGEIELILALRDRLEGTG